MKVIIVALAFVAVAAAAAIDNEQPQILRSDNTQTPEGNYNFSYETSNGISRNEGGTLKTVQNEKNESQDVVVVKGTFSYTDPNGDLQTVSYTADETGFHADGPNIPKSASRR